jgi:hypothetical protein
MPRTTTACRRPTNLSGFAPVLQPARMPARASCCGFGKGSALPAVRQGPLCRLTFTICVLGTRRSGPAISDLGIILPSRGSRSYGQSSLAPPRTVDPGEGTLAEIVWSPTAADMMACSSTRVRRRCPLRTVLLAGYAPRSSRIPSWGRARLGLPPCKPDDDSSASRKSRGTSMRRAADWTMHNDRGD